MKRERKKSRSGGVEPRAKAPEAPAKNPARGRAAAPPSDAAPPLHGNARAYPWIILAAIAMAYANAFAAPFVFDDRVCILENETIRSFSPPWKTLWGPVETGVAGRPVVNLSFAINYAISGTETWSYHLANIAIHAAAALILFGLIRRTLSRPQWQGRFGESGAAGVAFAVALLWALHPIQTQSVTYTITRNESLMATLYLLTLYGVARADEAPGQPLWPRVAIGACLAGMATKETMATAPLIALLFDRCLLAGSFREALARRSGLHAGLAATWVLLAGLIMSGPRTGTTGFGVDSATPIEYLRIQSTVITRYLRLAAWPSPLVFDYGWLPKVSWGEAAPYFAFVGALVAATLLALWRWPAFGFLGALFFAVLGPTSSVMPTTEFCWEYRMYLPLAAVITLAVLAARAAAGLAPVAPGRRTRAAAAMAGALALAYGALTIRRNHDYRSEIALMEDTIEKWPQNPRPYNEKGSALLHAGKAEEAIGFFLKAEEVNPQYRLAAANLGMAYSMLGKLDEAIAAYRRSLERIPDDAVSRNNLGVCLAKQGKMAEAAAEFRKAVELDPGYDEARENLARAERRK